MRLLFVINPVSGPGKKDWKEYISAWSQSLSHEAEYYLMEADTDNAAQIKKRIQSFNPDRIVTAGGDGTVKLVSGLLAGANIPMAILPAGSANGMARELQIPLNSEEALELAVNGNPSPLDLIRVNNEWCVHLSDMGLNATLLRYFESFPLRGMLGYAKALLKMIGKKTYMNLSISIDEKKINRKVLMIVIANASKYGTGAVINPKGRPDDGVFEVVVVRRLTIKELIRMLFIQKPFDPRRIEIFTCKKMTLESRYRYPFQIDGEYLGKLDRVEAQIEAGAVQVILPDDYEE